MLRGVHLVVSTTVTDVSRHCILALIEELIIFSEPTRLAEFLLVLLSPCSVWCDIKFTYAYPHVCVHNPHLTHLRRYSAESLLERVNTCGRVGHSSHEVGPSHKTHFKAAVSRHCFVSDTSAAEVNDGLSA